MEGKVVVVGGGGCGGGRGRKGHRGGGLREIDGRDALLKINILWNFVKFIDVFVSLLNYMNVLN